MKAVLASNPYENEHIISQKSQYLAPGGSIEYRIRSKINSASSVSWRNIEEKDVDMIILCDSDLSHGKLDTINSIKEGGQFVFNLRVQMYLKGSEIEFSYFKWKDEYDELDEVPRIESEILPLETITD